MTTKKQSPLRVGETHVQAVRDTFPGAVLDATWQAADQVTITVPTDMLPDVVEFLYYGRGGWLPNMVANDERPLHGCYALYYLLSMEESDPGFVVVRAEVDPHSMEYRPVTAGSRCVGERVAFNMFGLRAIGLPDDAGSCCRTIGPIIYTRCARTRGLPQAPGPRDRCGELLVSLRGPR